MLRSMRDDFKKYSWTLWLVIIAFLLGFSFTDIFSGGSVSKTVIAKIGDNEIKIERFQKQLLQTLDNYKNQMKGNFNKELITQMRIPEQILQNLINSSIIGIEAKKLNIRATKSELKEMIVNHPAFQKDGKFIGITKYKRYLAMFRTNAKDFESDLKKDIINNKLKQLVTASLVVDNDSLREKYRKEKDSVNLDYIKIKVDSKQSDFNASEEELKEYFEKNKDSFKTPERRSANIIALRFDDFKKDLKLKEQDYYDYFREKKDQFRIPEKIKISRIFIDYNKTDREEVFKRIEKLRKELNTSNFESSARLFSKDRKKDNGGDWGYSEWKSFTSQERSIIKSLKQSEISDPVDTLNGFSILYAKEKTLERQEPYETAKPKIKNLLEREGLRKIVRAKLDKIYKKIMETGNFDKVKNNKSLKIVETGYITNGEAVKDIEQFGYLSRKMFTMKEKEIDYPAEFIDGMAIIKLLSIKYPENESFENVKDKVRTLVIKDKRMIDAIKKNSSLTLSLNKISDKKKLEKFLNDKNMKLENINYQRGNELAGVGKNKKLDSIVFNSDENKFSNPTRIGNNIVIFRAKDIKATSETDFMNDREQFYKDKLTKMKNNYFVSFILNKRSKYDIGINRKLYDKVKESVLSRFN